MTSQEIQAVKYAIDLIESVKEKIRRTSRFRRFRHSHGLCNSFNISLESDEGEYKINYEAYIWGDCVDSKGIPIEDILTNLK